jgi:outer membrane receptor for ferrienterochelin and colicin
MMRNIVLVVCFFLTFLSINQVYGQNGSISGQVLDSQTGEEIIGANVVIKGTTTGASTDLYGNYTIHNVKPGTYTLEVTYVAYETKTLPGITVEPGQNLKLSIKLKENVTQLEDVIVTAVRETSTDLALLQTFKESHQVVSGISAEFIKKTPDSDASGVVKRIPGVTIIDNRFIVVRGLNERYNTVMLHNAYAPSVEADVKAFSFDILPSNMIDQILIYKSPSAELPGDFAGGLVKVFTKGIPEDNKTTISMGMGYREGSSLRPFMAEKRGNWHWTGFNDGKNDLPEVFPDNLRRFGNNSPIVTEAARMLSNNWAPEMYNSGLDYKFAISKNTRFHIGKVKVGNTTGITYSNSKTIFNDVVRRDYDVYDFAHNESDPKYLFTDTQYNHEISSGLIHNWGFRFSPNHMVEFKNLFNHSTDHQLVRRTGLHRRQNFEFDNLAYLNEYRGIYSGQLVGSHSFRGDNMKLEWIGGMNSSFSDMPDYRRIRRNVVGDDGTLLNFIPIAQSPHFFGKFYSNMSEKAYSLSSNFEHKLNLGGSFKPSYKTGFIMENKSREFSARNLGFVRASFTEFNDDLLTMPLDQLMSRENLNNIDGITLQENTNPNDSYLAGSRTLAGYFNLTLPFTPKLKLVSGARVENNVQELQSADNTGPIDIQNHNFNVLPSANIAYNFTDKTLIRAGYGMTVNRPEFREMAPFSFYDFNFDATRVGNPQIQQALIHNYDVRYEVYPSPLESIHIGAFYKRFINPIEALRPRYGSESTVFSFQNAPSAFSTGVELDVKKSLQGLTYFPFIDRLSLVLNGAWIYSRVDLSNRGDQQAERPLQGQSPYIFNMGVYYNDEVRDLQVNVLYNIIGRRIVFVGNTDVPNAYEMPRGVLDVTINKKLYKQLSLRLAFQDLLNMPVHFLMDGSRQDNLSSSNEALQTLMKFKPGRRYSIGLTYEF